MKDRTLSCAHLKAKDFWKDDLSEGGSSKNFVRDFFCFPFKFFKNAAFKPLLCIMYPCTACFTSCFRPCFKSRNGGDI